MPAKLPIWYYGLPFYGLTMDPHFSTKQFTRLIAKDSIFRNWNLFSFLPYALITRPLWYHNLQRLNSLAFLKTASYSFPLLKEDPKNSTRCIKSPETLGKGRIAVYFLTGHAPCPQTLMEALLGFISLESHSPFHTMNQWCEPIPILYKRGVAFVETFSRHTYRYTNMQTSLICILQELCFHGWHRWKDQNGRQKK